MNLQTRALGIYPAAASKRRDHPGSDGLLIQADRSTVATDGCRIAHGAAIDDRAQHVELVATG